MVIIRIAGKGDRYDERDFFERMFSLSAETIIELARHPNIIGLKESSGNLAKIGQLIHSAGDSFQVLAGSGSFLLPALRL